MPLHILTQIQAYIVNTKQLTNPICLTITGLSDSIAHLERIHSTPIPEAYACHMQQILLLYLAALPFQIVPSAGWMSIAITALAAYIMLGLRQIAQKIEDPFGHDAQDLPVDFYCDDVKECIEHISKREASGLKLEWSNPIALDNRVEKKQKR
ncbi:Bestrophin, RFP-TM, chloride channel-domain-containing protein [Obelidium mucronatum]|nr:Bestrophin, RFP-TM, chloride channel-domain-containing protein [Obelidium mucronatum]